jgi:hypothetical protein
MIHNHRYLMTTINSFDNDKRITVDKFLKSEMEYDVCMCNESYLPSCPKCFYKMCITCCDILSKQDTTFKCPRCRHEFERI